jgi:hypothetical protein
MMEAAKTSETLVNFYQTTRHYNPEDSHIRTHRRENLKSYSLNSVSFSLIFKPNPNKLNTNQSNPSTDRRNNSIKLRNQQTNPNQSVNQFNKTD